MRKLYHNGFEVSAALQQSGSFVYATVSAPFKAEVMIVAGGGGNGRESFGYGGGGGAGGVYTTGSLLIGTGQFDITIGSGGLPGDNTQGGDGTDTIVSGSNLHIVTIGGGGGGHASLPTGPNPGNDGGSGGGGASSQAGDGDAGIGLQPLSGSNNFGNDGGRSPQSNVFAGGAGGGGAVTAGEDYNGVSVFGSGGAGLISSISGTSKQYAAGGGGAQAGQSTVPTPGSGGSGGGSYNNSRGRNGIVIIRYEGPSIRARGGTLTKVGNDFVHTFTSDGVLYV